MTNELDSADADFCRLFFVGQFRFRMLEAKLYSVTALRLQESNVFANRLIDPLDRKRFLNVDDQIFAGCSTYFGLLHLSCFAVVTVPM